MGAMTLQQRPADTHAHSASVSAQYSPTLGLNKIGWQERIVFLRAWLQMGPRNCALPEHTYNKRGQWQRGGWQHGVVAASEMICAQGVSHVHWTGQGMRTWLTSPSPTHTGIEDSSFTTCRQDHGQMTPQNACCYSFVLQVSHCCSSSQDRPSATCSNVTSKHAHAYTHTRTTACTHRKGAR